MSGPEGGRNFCLAGIIRSHAARRPHAAAVLGNGRDAITYGELECLFHEVGRRLGELGIGQGDRAAMVLPNGPEMATSFLCVAGAATAAPLNPAYRRAEFEFYLSDLQAKTLIVQAGMQTEAVDAAVALGINIIELHPSPTRAGLFELSGEGCRSTDDPGQIAPEDPALVLHTSGTTSRPKIVPLSQANICISARNIARSLELGPADRCLNVMPLFHIHGLVGGLLSTLFSGGSIACCTSFDASRFLEDLKEMQATWYTAVPTIHQAVLAAAGAGNGSRVESSLRFIRSCSSPLPPSVMQQLEETFSVPVIEAYGMTEASHQMSCNPLPPRNRKPGSVGTATGIEIGVMNAAGALLPPDAEGEVVIRGPGVTAGYENNPEANKSAFTNGWFRTGDQGRVDEEGYLFLTGRIKEIINRGGEKISPREIDDVVARHPAVAQATTFALPHPTLGEQVATAIVVKAEHSPSQKDIQRHVAAALAEFKVPQKVVFVSEIPKGPTGKPQRIGLAEKLGLTVDAQSKHPKVATDRPTGETEERLAALWAQLLGKRDFGREDDFLDSGGDSLLAAQLVALVERTFGVWLPIRTLFESGTIAQMAAVIETLPQTTAEQPQRHVSLVPFQTSGSKPPFFMVHGHSGRSIGLGFIAPHLDADQPYYGFVARGMDGRLLPRRTIAAIAADYIREIKEVDPQGPYYLGGFCSGGMITYEMACQLITEGRQVALLALLDTAHPDFLTPPSRLLQTTRNVKLHIRRLLFRAFLAVGRRAPVRLGERIVNETIRRGAMTYVPQPYPGEVTLIRSAVHFRSSDPDLGWTTRARQSIDLRPVPGDHSYILTRENISPAARQLQVCLNEAHAAQSTAAKSNLIDRDAVDFAA